MAFDRRSMLMGSAALALPLFGCETKPSEKKGVGTSSNPPVALKGRNSTLICLGAVSQVLLPDDGKGPSAKALGVPAYLEKALKRPDLKQVRGALERGAQFLDSWAKKEHGKTFASLESNAQFDVVTQLAEGKLKMSRLSGKQFVQVMLALTLEGALGDPSHAGNKDKAGWEWLGYKEEGRS